MPAKLQEGIRTIIVNLDSSETGQAILASSRITGIRKAQDKDYEPHRRMINAVFGKGASPR
jgi:ABC-type phosphate/phosphonate transport system substrate-binding protein